MHDAARGKRYIEREDNRLKKKPDGKLPCSWNEELCQHDAIIAVLDINMFGKKTNN